MKSQVEQALPAVSGLLLTHGLRLIRRVIDLLHDLIVLLVEVLLDDLDGLFVNLVVLVVLQLLEAVEHAVALCGDREGVHLTLHEMGRAALKNILDSLDRDSNDCLLLHFQDFAQCLEQTLLDHLMELLRLGDGRRIAERPDCLHLDGRVVVQQDMAELVDEAAIDASLQLLVGAGRQVGHDPAHFLTDGPLRVVQRFKHGRKEAEVDQLLRLVVRASSKVTDGADNGDLDR